MRKVKILTDSTCDIIQIDGQDGMQKYDLDFIPLYVNLDGKVFKDAVSITTEEILDYCEEHKVLPKTSSPSCQDFIDFFKKYIDQDYDIVFLGLGSKLSSSYQTALIAASEFEEGRIHVIESASLSSAVGLSLIRACKLRDEGKSAEEIATFLKDTVSRTKCSFVIDSLEYLYKGGRCSGLAYLVGSLIRIKPLIALKDGRLGMTAKVLGKRASIIGMIKRFAKEFEAGNVLDDFVLITHDLAFDEAKFIKEELIKIGVKEESIHTSIAAGVVSCHCGRKTIGIIYTTK